MEARWNPSTWRRLLFLSVAGVALAATTALKPAEAREAPCGDFTGLKCVEVEWCFGIVVATCGSKVLSRYRSGEELPAPE
jgi:hypothetical protein